MIKMHITKNDTFVWECTALTTGHMVHEIFYFLKTHLPNEEIRKLEFASLMHKASLVNKETLIKGYRVIFSEE